MKDQNLNRQKSKNHKQKIYFESERKTRQKKGFLKTECPLINLKRKSFLKIMILSSHLFIKFNEKNDFSSRLTSILFLVPSVYINLKLNAP